MQISEEAKKISGLDYLLQRLEIQSGVGRECLLQSRWYRPGEEALLCTELERVERLKAFMAEGAVSLIDKLKLKFSQVWDIRKTFDLIGSGVVDDVQLFEVKRFALLCGETGKLLEELVKTCALHPAPSLLPPLDEVVAVLDPRGEKLATFHIYSEYDAELARLRSVIKNAGEVDASLAELQAQCEERERTVREKLCAKLCPHLPALREAMDQAAYWDLLIAKAALAQKYNLNTPYGVRTSRSASPKMRAGRPARHKAEAPLAYTALFNPMVKELLEQQGARYQAVDIDLQPEPCLLTGANMSGKTVLLKTLALSQTLLQFGFPVPAAEATLPLFDKVELLVSDEQDEQRGLSSFGAEIQRLNRVFAELKEGMNLLLLIDEPARTTNPAEGKALVCALLDTLSQNPCTALISTHYGPIPNPVRRLRVRGFTMDADREVRTPYGARTSRSASHEPQSGSPSKPEPQSGEETKLKPQSGKTITLNIQQIQDHIDYSLVEEDPSTPPPTEALRIAALLGFDEDTLSLARRYYSHTKQ